jgi:hypothetical protein
MACLEKLMSGDAAPGGNLDRRALIERVDRDTRSGMKRPEVSSQIQDHLSASGVAAVEA